VAEPSNLAALAEKSSTPFVGVVSSKEARFAPFSRLPPVRPDAPTLPPELLPAALRPWIVDGAERMQVPLEFIAVPAIVALAAVVGRRMGIHPKAKDDWLVVPNLWGGVVARPGMIKSPAQAEGLKPIRRLAAEAREEFERRQEAEGVRLDSLQAQETAIKNLLRRVYEGKKGQTIADLEDSLRAVREQLKEIKDNLVERRYIVNDTTTEKLGEILRFNPLGLLLERDELAGWLRSLERDDRKADREFYLESWNGLNPYIYDRIGRGTVHIPALCLSIVGGIQPAKLDKFVSEALDGGFAADGLLQRIQLLVWPDLTSQWRLVDERPLLQAREKAFALFSALDRCALGRESSPDHGMPTLRFDPDAQALFYEWLTLLQRRLQSEEILAYPAFESHLAKYRSLMPSLALLFHLVDCVQQGDLSPVSLPAATLAADWCEYLEVHARKVYAAELGTDITAAHALAAKIREGALHDGMTVRDVYRSGWSSLRASEVVFGGLAVLQQHGWLALEVVDGNGRPSQVIRINPARTEAP